MRFHLKKCEEYSKSKNYIKKPLGPINSAPRNSLSKSALDPEGIL